MERDYMLTIATGRKRVGKTYRTAREIESYMMDDPKIGRRGKKVLIFDVNEEPEWGRYPTMMYDPEETNKIKRCDNIIKFTRSPMIHARRIRPVDKRGQPMSAGQMVQCINDIKEFYRGGMTVYEDTNKIITSKNQDQIIDVLISTRHIHQDVVLHVQSLSGITPRMFQNIDILRMHKQSDVIDRIRDRIPNFPILKIAEITVDRRYLAGDTYYILYVMIAEEKILNLSLEDYKVSAKAYLDKYPRDLKPYLHSHKNREKAISAWINEHLYYIK